MKKVMKRVLGTLRSAFHAEPDAGEVACWVPGCAAAPAMVLAGTEDGVLVGCQEHARRWVVSDACRLAADSGGGRVVEALERWAEELGAYAQLASVRPRNDVRILERELSQGLPSP
jgi:hypothetical protein